MLSKIRLWKLGSLEHRIVPNQDAVNKLQTILKSAHSSNDELMDIIWGPDLEVQEIGINDTIEQFVVEEMKEVDDEVHIRARRVTPKGITEDKGDVDE